jgi:ketol-acid reductoisomerase
VEEAEGGMRELKRLMEECEALEIERVGREIRRMSGIQEET